MIKFPIAWDDRSPRGEEIANVCPYSPEDICSYLNTCHYHYATNEPILQFPQPSCVLEYKDSERSLWLWELNDGCGREWWVVVGTGVTPFYRATNETVWRWMYAETKENEEGSETYVARTLRELKENQASA